MRDLTLLALCIAFVAGCALKAPPPRDGICGFIHDACSVGTPAGTGDTSPPYEWRCLGENGGAPAACSLPIARIESDETFAGQNALADRLKTAGPLRGTFAILDFTADLEPGDEHADHAPQMRRVAIQMKVPEENLAVVGTSTPSRFLTSDRWRDVSRSTLVGAVPTAWVFSSEASWERHRARLVLPAHDVLFVGAAGNTGTYSDDPDTPNVTRDLWYPDHPLWDTKSWDVPFGLFGTGRVIIAKYANFVGGGVSPHMGNVKCGMAADYCYSVIRPREGGDGTSGTSSASVRVGAMAFYLFQIWETPEEVIGVLNVCADDVGEPGVDEEYGRGVVSVVCETVQTREIGAVARSLTGSPYSHSPAFRLMDQLPEPQSSRPRFVPLFAVHGFSHETLTGHTGGRLALPAADLFVSAGVDFDPLGVRSPLTPIVRSPFAEVAAERRLRGLVSVFGHAGYATGPLAVRSGRLGVRLAHPVGAGTLAVRLGYRRVTGDAGIRGYRQAGAGRVPFAADTPEVFVYFALR